MTNEIIFIGSAALCLILSLLAFKMGRRWTSAYVVVICATLVCVSAKISNVFGLPVGLGEAIFACLFLTTDMTVERYGKKAGIELVMLGFASLLIFTGLIQFSLMLSPDPEAAGLSDAMDSVFSLSFRVTAAGFTAYLISQLFDIWFYHFIRNKTGEKLLWLRNNASTITSQALNAFLYYFLAFYGVFTGWLEIAFAGFALMIIIAMFDTPLMYLSKKITPNDLKEKA